MRHRLLACLCGLLLIPASLTAAQAAGGAVLATERLTTSVSPSTSSVVVDDGQLALETGTTVQPYDFTGINAYQLASDWNVNYGCGWGGWTSSSLDAFFSQLQPNELVRMWAFQYLATNRYTGQRDWTALDQVIAAADEYHAHLILTLGNQDGTCDDSHWKDPAWYAGGYNDVYNAYGSTPESYAGWVHDVVSRYAGNPAIAMWEPINEPQAAACSIEATGNGPSCWGNLSCPDEQATTQTLVTFFDTIGGEIHALDPGTLVSDGSLGGGECGVVNNSDFSTVIGSPGIDVVGYHDYSGLVALPSDLSQRVQDAQSLGKPTMIGEAGIFGCSSAAQQASMFQQKITAAWATGVSAYLPWRFDNDNGNPTCSDVIDFDSPSMAVITSQAHDVGQAAQISTPVTAIATTVPSSPLVPAGTTPSSHPAASVLPATPTQTASAPTKQPVTSAASPATGTKMKAGQNGGSGSSVYSTSPSSLATNPPRLGSPSATLPATATSSQTNTRARVSRSSTRTKTRARVSRSSMVHRSGQPTPSRRRRLANVTKPSHGKKRRASPSRH
jgi:hypothetical protein